jgi:peptide/nickel transport system substrate-binding protein
VAACAALVLSACGGAPRAEGAVVIASGTDLEGMQPLATVHPLSRQVQRHLVFTPLVALDSTLAIVPRAAVSWTWSEGGRVLTFAIDTSLRWHDGAPVTARDAAFTLALAADARTAWARRAELDGMAGEVVDDGSFRVRFDRVPGEVPLVLTELPLLPAHRLAAVDPARLREDPFTLAPVGSGPYRVVRREAGRRWILERVTPFPARLGGPGAAPVLVIAVVDEATTKVAGLVSGALDLAGVNPATAALVERDPTLRLVTYPTLFTNWLVFTADRPPFDDVRVRRAVALALDRRRLVDGGIGGFATPSAAWTADAARDTTPADTARADSLLDAAGWRRGADGMRARDGRPFAVTLLCAATADNAVEQLLQGALRARGIAVTIATREPGAMLAAARDPRRAHELLVTGVPGDLARGQLALLFGPSGAGGALDFGGARPPTFGAALAAVRTAPDRAARDRAWAAAFAVLDSAVPATPLYHARGVQGASRRLEGVRIDLRGELATAPRWRLAPR